MITNITGNIISGQLTGETAKQLSERFGRIMQDRNSLSINRNDTSISQSKQLESAIPPSKISALSSGEFLGMIADDPNLRIELKIFHAEIINDHDALKKEISEYRAIPIIREVNTSMIQLNYRQVQKDIEDLMNSEMERIINDPEQAALLLKK